MLALAVLFIAASSVSVALASSPSVGDKSDAYFFGQTALSYARALQKLAVLQLPGVTRDFQACAADYSTSADRQHVDTVLGFVAYERGSKKVYAPWKRMLDAWVYDRPRDPTLRTVLSEAQADKQWVRKFSSLPAPKKPCDVLAEAKAANWASSFLQKEFNKWLSSGRIDVKASTAINARVSRLTPKLRALGLTTTQISAIVDSV